MTDHNRGWTSRTLRRAAAAALAGISAFATPSIAQYPGADLKLAPRISVIEATIPDLQAAMSAGLTTSSELVAEYLRRISIYDNRLNATITVNSHALEQAQQRDRERAAGIVRGPLHGIPIALKDNIQVAGMRTTGGALAFRNFVAPYDATIVQNLEELGAIIIAKTGMTELANWMSAGMPGNFNAITGFGMNPYDPRPDPLESDGRPVLPTGGSSSGIGTAANLWMASVGTETDGSILSPASQTMLVGIKPTVGRVSRYGIIPISDDQDTPGPMARSVTDAAILLGAMEGRFIDPMDLATGYCERVAGSDYTAFLRPDGLRGARIGIPRAYFYAPVTVPGSPGTRGGLSPEQLAAMEAAIEVLRRAGAVIVDPVDIPSIVSQDPEENFLLWPVCSDRVSVGPRRGNGCSNVLRYGMKRDFERWLQTLGRAAPVHSLAELREWNQSHAEGGSMLFGQIRLDISDAIDLERDYAHYRADREKDLRLAAENGLDAALDGNDLDALLFAGASGASIAARPGYPSIVVPFARVPNDRSRALPADFEPELMPMGVSFTGRACSEPRLIELAYAFEQASRRRIPPPALP